MDTVPASAEPVTGLVTTSSLHEATLSWDAPRAENIGPSGVLGYTYCIYTWEQSCNSDAVIPFGALLPGTAREAHNSGLLLEPGVVYQVKFRRYHRSGAFTEFEGDTSYQPDPNGPGFIDRAFGDAGVVTHPVPRDGSGGKLLVDGQGRIVLVERLIGADGLGLIRGSRFLSSGEIDTSFGTDGSFAIHDAEEIRLRDASLDAAGHVLVAYSKASSSQLRLTRWVDGDLDVTFGAMGTVLTDVGEYGEELTQALVDTSSSGDIYVAVTLLSGRTNVLRTLVYRFDSTGVLSPTWNGGMPFDVATPSSDPTRVTSIMFDDRDDTLLLAVGGHLVGDRADILRLSLSGSKIVWPVTGDAEFEIPGLNGQHDDIVRMRPGIAGSLLVGSVVSLARISPLEGLDQAFGENGYIPSSDLFDTDSEGRIVYASQDGKVTRQEPAGGITYEFGQFGTSPIPPFPNYPRDLVIGADDRILVYANRAGTYRHSILAYRGRP